MTTPRNDDGSAAVCGDLDIEVVSAMTNHDAARRWD